jgi:hypothetical protein
MSAGLVGSTPLSLPIGFYGPKPVRFLEPVHHYFVFGESFPQTRLEPSGLFIKMNLPLVNILLAASIATSMAVSVSLRFEHLACSAF